MYIFYSYYNANATLNNHASKEQRFSSSYILRLIINASGSLLGNSFCTWQLIFFYYYYFHLKFIYIKIFRQVTFYQLKTGKMSKTFVLHIEKLFYAFKLMVTY